MSISAEQYDAFRAFYDSLYKYRVLHVASNNRSGLMQANKEFLDATIEDFDKLFEQHDIQNFLLSIISNDNMQSFKAYTLNRVITARDAAHKVIDQYSNELNSAMKLYEFPDQMKELYEAAYSVRFFSAEFHEIISQSLQLYVEQE